LQHDDHAAEADQNGKTAVDADALAEDRDREKRDEKRRAKRIA
jgi:hypothetical protein